MARTLRMRDTSNDATFDLNLAPMMDMMVSIIPFLLLSVTFMQVMIIETPLPLPVAQALSQDREKKDREVTVDVKIAKKGFSIEVKDLSGKVSRMEVPMANSQYNYTELHKKLIEVKQRFPKLFRVGLIPEENIDYNSIVKTMDAARSVEKGDPKILIDNVESPLMFPDAILSNVME